MARNKKKDQKAIAKRKRNSKHDESPFVVRFISYADRATLRKVMRTVMKVGFVKAIPLPGTKNI